MRRWVILIGLLWALTVPAQAQLPVEEEELRADLPASAAELMDQIDFETELSTGITQILEKAAAGADGYWKAALRQAGQMMAVCLLCGVLITLEQDRTAKAVILAGVLTICVIGVTILRTLTKDSGGAIKQLCDYANTLLPAIAMTTASTGCVTSAAALYTGTVFFVSLLENLILRLLQPLVFVYLGLACASAATDEAALQRIKELVGWLISAGLKTVLFVFTAYLTITGAISGSADSTTVKAAKMTLSGVVPVVGSMISDASETLLVSVSLLRNSIGIFGVLAVLGICILPFLQCAIRYLILKAAAAFSGLFAPKQLHVFMGDFSSAVGYLLAMTGSCALMLVISFVCYIRVVV